MLLSDKHVSACGPCSFYLYICAEYSKKKKDLIGETSQQSYTHHFFSWDNSGILKITER